MHWFRPLIITTRVIDPAFKHAVNHNKIEKTSIHPALRMAVGILEMLRFCFANPFLILMTSLVFCNLPCYRTIKASLVYGSK